MTISNHHETAMTVLGEAGIDDDGIVSGWCWSPERPGARLTVEIFVNGEMVAMPVAERFRGDLHDRGIGDGYHGFWVAITTRVQGGGGFVVSARERRSGVCFWQSIIGTVALPPAVMARMAGVTDAMREIGQSTALVPAASTLPAASLRAALGALGGRLQTGGGLGVAQARMAALPPALSVVLNAACVRDAARGGALPGDLPWAGAGFEYVLCDDGRDPRLGRWQDKSALAYMLAPGLHAAARWQQELRLARGEMLVFLGAVTPGLGGALAALRDIRAGGVVISARLAAAARLRMPDLAARMTAFHTDLRLDFSMAGPRAAMLAHG
ncbi:MAG: hypothetical protein POH28_16575, partial [Acidocella sp.]|nr:hypothetical protein [Acidocella sp.]